MESQFWLKNPKVLINNFLRFIPTKNYNEVENYNAITLFCIYLIILLLIFKKPIQWLYIPIIIMVIIILMYFVKSPEKFNNIIETGYINSDDKLQFARTTNEEKRDKTMSADLSYKCRRPTKDNPYMNPDVTNFNTPAPAPCNSDDEQINNEITKSFNHDLYMDVDDAFEKMNSQRQFYTVPTASIPNNRDDFANWLYKSPATCKEDQEQCLRYEDLRYKR